MSESDRTRGESVWLATTETTDYGPLEEGLDVDVAVVGGGITGLTTAINLQDEGRSVALIEADRICEGVTGHTTAKITSQHGLTYDSLLSKVTAQKAQQYADANQAAIEEVLRRVEKHGIDCDFERTEAYTYTTDSDEVEDIRKEVQAAKQLDLPATFAESTPLPFDVEAAVRFDDQAKFHPRSYLLEIARQFDENGGYIFEQTQATDINTARPVTVETEHGSVEAEDVVVATHFPFFDRAGYFTRMYPYRSYLLAVRIEETHPDGMFLGNSSAKYSIRKSARGEDGEKLLLVGGHGHKQGAHRPPPSERYRLCEEFARKHFSVEEVEYRWSTMDYTPVDNVPFIGQIDPLGEHVYVGTGFKGWGMSGGVAAGMILTDLIVEGSSSWEDVFDPQRLPPVSSASNFVTENSLVGVNFVSDWLTAMLSPSDIPQSNDEATICRHKGEPMGIYRDEEGTVHAVSAICPHLNCIVEWNDAERTWDCPCHGSRFNYDGDVLHGPALEDLPDRDVE